MRKIFWILIVLLFCASITVSSAEANILAGKLTEEKFVNHQYIVSTGFSRWVDRVYPIEFKEDGTIDCAYLGATHWKIGEENTLDLYIGNELYLKMVYDHNRNCLVVKKLTKYHRAQIHIVLVEE